MTKLEPIGNRGGYIVANESLYERLQPSNGDETATETEEEKLFKLPKIGAMQRVGMHVKRRGGHPGKRLMV